MKYPSVLIFGGAGYIGSYLASYLLAHEMSEKIILADISRVKEKSWPQNVKQAEKDGRVQFVEVDVRNPIDAALLPKSCDLIANFAAIHREPGHKDFEYFETNLAGAQNVCDWARAVECPRIVFTSSIAPYGISPEPKTEKSLTVPVTAYGSSKLTAEKMHQTWQAEVADSRFLIIVRPGVIFGPGEQGIVPRMIRALRKGYFFYAGNTGTVKAGGYIKELPRSLGYILEKQEKEEEYVTLYNFSFSEPPSFDDYVENIKAVAGLTRRVPFVPFWMLMTAGTLIDLLAKPLGISHPFSPVRLKKLIRPNHIIREYLNLQQYQYKYDLRQALEDWKVDAPQDWV
jgi:nucleoside-diphosphate-sugar epimerase